MNDFYKEQKTEGFIYTVELFVDDGAPVAFCTTLEQAVTIADEVLTELEASVGVPHGSTATNSYDWPRIYTYSTNVLLGSFENQHVTGKSIVGHRAYEWELRLYEARKLRGKA